MINAIIFSKNRACQLHLLLESIERFGNILNDVYIIYKAEEGFTKGYKRVQSCFPLCVWMDEQEFQRDTISLIKYGSDYICFFVDDNFIHREIPGEYNELNALIIQNQIDIFSLRLGKNTIYCNWKDKKYTPMPKRLDEVEDNNIFVWNWHTIPPHTNFGYPFSVDGHIYPKELLLECLDYKFENPNALEGRIKVNKLPNKMACFGKSCVVNNPINLVGSSNGWISNERTLKELEQLYISGKHINLDKLLENKIEACHQGMEIQFNE